MRKKQPHELLESYLNATEEEIKARARELYGETLRSYHQERAVEAVEKRRINPKNKGKLGNLIEFLHFGINPNNRPGADFIAANIELKTTGLKVIKTGLVAKERLSLGSIDYMKYEDAGERVFANSGLLRKSRALLLMAYLYERDVEIIDLGFKVIDIWPFNDEDLAIIKQDWDTIMDKIQSGNAHLLSDSDTLYLTASTKGKGGGTPRPQPFNKHIDAKKRGFALRQAYVDHIIAKLSGKTGQKYGRIITNPEEIRKRRRRGLEKIVLEHFGVFVGQTIDQISARTGVRKLNPRAKNFAAQVTRAVLKIGLDKKIEEFEKAGIIVRSVRLENTNLPEQSISFPAFKYKSLIYESWEESDFHRDLRSKFLFVFFRTKDSVLSLEKAKFWTMPEEHVTEAKKVWKRTVNLVKAGRIVKGICVDRNGKETRLTFFPDKGDNLVAHVRPHGSTAKDTDELPVRELFTDANEYTKHCFWINNTYVRDFIYPN